MDHSLIFQQIKFKLNQDTLAKELRVDRRRALKAKLSEMVTSVEKLAKPKAVIQPVTLQSTAESAVTINEVEFASRILKINLSQSASIFAVVVTCGSELEDWIRTIDDHLYHYWADLIGDGVLRQAVHYIDSELCARYQAETVSWMTPGSLSDWPIEEQKNLFQLFQGKHQRIGVELTKQNIMRPLKSLSGFVFATREPFYSCQLCGKKKCHQRRAEFNTKLADKKYSL